MKHFDEMELIDEWRNNLKVGSKVRLPFGPDKKNLAHAVVESFSDDKRYIIVREENGQRTELRPLNCIPPNEWYIENPEVDAWKPWPKT